MNADDKALLATFGIGLIAGGSYFGYSYLFGPKDDESFASLLGESVLTLTGSTNKTEWEARLKELQAKKSELSGTLISIADQNWDDLQTWCRQNSNKNLKKDVNYVGFEEFCTWKIGDKEWVGKISSDTQVADDKWSNAHRELNRRDRRRLSPELQKIQVVDIKKKPDNKAMHDWCTGTYKKIWRGESSRDYADVQEFCKSTAK
ncbi:hypothetical protein A6V39_00695 [Candidatus Mycoplasma haematobovis]|uniref:Uncharacterized protein n=1 Tax=Candidatus Mycoplasma haematobovis TaxID=432608 RepID=A0A1A9QFS7_9MOLU|nr:hypothetical protein [Candidatus Mycoplasma haematobovis]OAL10569.1 hypothetical protein A6V39_00695 [Candidatus Mycoplasma haematobovis]